MERGEKVEDEPSSGLSEGDLDLIAGPDYTGKTRPPETGAELALSMIRARGPQHCPECGQSRRGSRSSSGKGRKAG